MAKRGLKLGGVGEDVELLPHIHLRFVSKEENARAYFERGVLSAILGRLPREGSEQQRGLALWRAVQDARFLWMLNASALSHAGLGGANRSTWNTRVNCRPVMVNVTPGSRACRVFRLCPFCYARKCWKEYSHLRNKLFEPGSEICNRGIIVCTRRFHIHASTPTELETVIFQNLAAVRQTRDTNKSKRRLAAMAGWFRNQRTWATKLKDGRYRFVIEFMLLGASRDETDIPVSAFLTPNQEPPDRKAEGLVDERTWYDPALTKTSFRKWMIRSMRYRPELLKNDIGVSMAYNRPMLELRAQQFYGGGEFRHRTESSTSSEEDFEESSADE